MSPSPFSASKPIKPPRVPWREFPDAGLLAEVATTKHHPAYAAAKSGDSTAASDLVDDLVDDSATEAAQALTACVHGARPVVLLSAHAYESAGVNAIPAALAQLLSRRFDMPYDSRVVQTNVVGHTGADGYGRLARQAMFGGVVANGSEFLLVDDFVGQGGTLANLRGWVETQGGIVIGAVGLTGKAHSAKLKPSGEQLEELRQKHGPELEEWWHLRFGHAFDCLTQSEARYLARSPDADTIRNRIAAAEQAGSV